MIEKLIAAYYQHLRRIDPRFHWRDRDWWRHPELARVVTVGPRDAPRGFAIIGYGRFVDGDVASEICELYCPDPALLLLLVRRALAQLRAPAGFQVLCANDRALRCCERLASRLGLALTRSESDDDGTLVFKYRFMGDRISRA